jgi:ribosomal protein L40E
MLGGRTPFTGDMMQLVMQKIMQTPPPLSTLRSDIPAQVENVIMRALEREAEKRPASVVDWIVELERAAENVSETETTGRSRLVILAPVGAEVYVNDERKGSVGSSGRLILSSIPAGNHILRVSKLGEKDDERLIEIRDDSNEQVIQAQLKSVHSGSQPSASQGGGSGNPPSSLLPGIVACTRCNSRFAEGAKFCGRCGNSSFTLISPGDEAQTPVCPRCSAQLPAFTKFCGRCGYGISQSGNIHASQPPSFNSNYQVSYPQPVQRVCSRCRTAFPPNIKFCGRCGTSLSG